MGQSSSFAYRTILGLVVITIILSVLYYTFGQVVPPGYMGVRQVTFGPGQGYSDKALRPGLHVTLPFMVKIHLVPETIQLVEFRRGETDAEFSALQVKSNDGVAVDVDVSIVTRFFPEKVSSAEGSHGGPADLVQHLGTDPEKWDQQVRRIAANELKRQLSSLTASEMYADPVERQKKIDEAAVRMRAELNEYGISVESVLLRRYTFSAGQFDDTVFKKNLEDIEKELRILTSGLEAVKSKVQDRAAFWDAEAETLRVQGDNEAFVLRSNATLFENEKRAEGDLLVAKAQADVDKRRASALSQTAGADVYVARQLAPLLTSLKGGVISNVDPFNIDDWAAKLGLGNGRARYVPKEDVHYRDESPEDGRAKP